MSKSCRPRAAQSCYEHEHSDLLKTANYILILHGLYSICHMIYLSSIVEPQTPPQAWIRSWHRGFGFRVLAVCGL